MATTQMRETHVMSNNARNFLVFVNEASAIVDHRQLPGKIVFLEYLFVGHVEDQFQLHE